MIQQNHQGMHLALKSSFLKQRFARETIKTIESERCVNPPTVSVTKRKLNN